MMRWALILSILIFCSIAYLGARHEDRLPVMSKRSDLSDILRHASEYDGKHIAVTGTVTGAASIFDSGGYWLKAPDGSRVLVLSTTGVPPTDSNVTVRGTFRQAAVVDDAHFDVIVAER